MRLARVHYAVFLLFVFDSSFVDILNFVYAPLSSIRYRVVRKAMVASMEPPLKVGSDSTIDIRIYESHSGNHKTALHH